MSHKKSLKHVAVAAIPAIALAIHACTQPLTLEDVLVRPSSMSAVGSTTFSATAGSVVQNPAKVRVLDQNNEALANQSVTFAASRGTLSAATASTNEQGEANPATWTAPNQAGAATITASVPAEFGVANVVFNVTVTAAAPATQSAGPGSTPQTAIAGQAVGTPPEVRIVDQFGNGIQGVVVTFTVQTGGGTLNGSSATTANVTSDANGSAKLTSWVLGPTVGTNNNTLRATTAVLPAQPVTFTASGTVGPVSKIVIAPPGNSQGQSAVRGTQVAVAPAVLVTDANNNPIASVGIRFAIALGGGKVIASDNSQVAILDVTTNASGIASTNGWLLWENGSNTITVTVPTASGVTPFTISATGTPAPPATIAVVAETPSSNNQFAAVGDTTDVRPGVVVKDSDGFVVASTSVTFTVGANSGTIKTTQASSPSTTGSVTTNAAGVARLFSWTLANRGPNTLAASVTSNTNITLTFTATGVAGPPASIEIQNPGTMNNQTTVANTPVPNAPAVLVKDANGLTVDDGHEIAFVITNGGGVVSATGCSGAATAVVVATDVNGVAAVGCWKPGSVGTSNTLRASVVGTPSLFVTFVATGTVGPPTQITFTNGPWLYTQASTTNGGVPKVTVKDAAGNPVSGLTINWSNAGNANSTVGGTTTSSTDASGVAQFGGAQGGTWTAAAVASGQLMTLQATVSGAPSVTVSTQSTVVGAPSTMTVQTTQPSSAAVNTVVSPAPVVVVRDAANRPVPKSAVTWTITANPGGTSGATLTGADTQTDSVGQADPGSWKLASTVGSNSIQAAIPSPVVALSFTTTGVAGAASQIAINAGNNQSAGPGTAVTTPPSVAVRDQFSNAVSGVSVTFSPTTGSSSVTGSPANTNASGIATVGSWTLGPALGTHQLQAVLTSNTSVTTTFSATASLDACATAHTIGQPTVNGTLAATDCHFVHESGTGTKYGDVYRITVPAATTRYFRVQLNSSAFGPQIRSYVYKPDNSYWYNSNSTPANIASFFVLGPGTHDIVATSEGVTTTGAYNFVSDLNPAIPAGSCGNFVTTKNVTVTSHTLVTTDCKYVYNGAGTAETPSRRYLLYLPAGQSATVNVSGVTVDWYLEAYDVSATRTFITSADVGSGGAAESMTIAASPTANRFIEIRVTHYQPTTPPAGTYPYTLSINP